MQPLSNSRSIAAVLEACRARLPSVRFELWTWTSGAARAWKRVGRLDGELPAIATRTHDYARAFTEHASTLDVCTLRVLGDDDQLFEILHVTARVRHDLPLSTCETIVADLARVVATSEASAVRRLAPAVLEFVGARARIDAVVRASDDLCDRLLPATTKESVRAVIDLRLGTAQQREVQIEHQYALIDLARRLGLVGAS